MFRASLADVLSTNNMSIGSNRVGEQERRVIRGWDWVGIDNNVC